MYYYIMIELFRNIHNNYDLIYHYNVYIFLSFSKKGSLIKLTIFFNSNIYIN